MSLLACRTSSIEVLGASGRVTSAILSFGSATREAESAIGSYSGTRLPTLGPGLTRQECASHPDVQSSFAVGYEGTSQSRLCGVKSGSEMANRHRSTVLAAVP